MSSTLRLMLRMLRRDWRAGELTVLGLALAIAVASLTSVGFLTDRVARALEIESHQLLGGDLLLSADHPWRDAIRSEIGRRGLQAVDITGFPSMVSTGQSTQLADIKAVTPGYPLRGALRMADALNAPDRETRAIPARGSVWLDERLAAALDAQPGTTVTLGASRLTVAAILTQEPDRGMNMLALAPRLLMHHDDLPATGLIQPASRIAWRLQLAGEPKEISDFSQWLQPRLERGERLEDMRNARPETRTILERAQRFLRLAALLAVVLAAVAVRFAADRYMRRHLDGCAVMRCLGARQKQILLLHGGEFLLFGLCATLLGCLAGFAAQAGLQALLGDLLRIALPAPSWLPWAHGLLVGLVLVAGFAAPPLLRLHAVPTLRVLRQEWRDSEPLSLGAYGFGALALAGLMLWVAGEWMLGSVVIAGFALALALYALCARLALRAVEALFGRIFRLIPNNHAGWRSGMRLALSSLRRHESASILQATALALGLTALLLLTVARGDLLASWQQKLPPDAPNRFVINIQPDQRESLQAFFVSHGLAAPQLEPMIRGRLVALNDRPVTPEQYEEERARHLVDREFNLSWSAAMPPGNTIVAGRWHGDSAAAEFSVERGLAEALGLKLGDRLTYDIAGQRVTGQITSLRRLNWDSMRVNFFVIAPPALLRDQPASDITSFHLPSGHGQSGFVNALVRQFPNLTVIDVAALVRQMQDILDQVVQAVEIVFGFALLAGLMVLYAALQSSQDERQHELALLRALGVRHRQLHIALLAEFALLGGIAGTLAALGTSAISWALAALVFQLAYLPSPWMLPIGYATGTLGTALAGWLGTRAVLRRPPLESLRWSD